MKYHQLEKLLNEQSAAEHESIEERSKAIDEKLELLRNARARIHEGLNNLDMKILQDFDNMVAELKKYVQENITCKQFEYKEEELTVDDAQKWYSGNLDERELSLRPQEPNMESFTSERETEQESSAEDFQRRKKPSQKNLPYEIMKQKLGILGSQLLKVNYIE